VPELGDTRPAMPKPVNKALLMNQADAETVAAQGLAFLAEDLGRLSRFFALTGLDAEAVRSRADTPEFLAAVLQYLAGDESLLLTFAANWRVAPEAVGAALFLLQDGRQ